MTHQRWETEIAQARLDEETARARMESAGAASAAATKRRDEALAKLRNAAESELKPLEREALQRNSNGDPTPRANRERQKALLAELRQKEAAIIAQLDPQCEVLSARWTDWHNRHGRARSHRRDLEAQYVEWQRSAQAAPDALPDVAELLGRTQ